MFPGVLKCLFAGGAGGLFGCFASGGLGYFASGGLEGFAAGCFGCFASGCGSSAAGDGDGADGGFGADAGPVDGAVVVFLLGDADSAGGEGPGQAHERDPGGPADAGAHEGDTGHDRGPGRDVLPVVLQPVPGGRDPGLVGVAPSVHVGVAERVQAGRVGEGDRVVGGVRVGVAGPAGPGRGVLGVGAEEGPGGGVVDAGAQQLEAAGFKVTQDVREYNQIESEALAGKFHAVLVSRSTVLDSGDAVAYMTADFSSSGSYSMSGLHDEKVDAAISKAAATQPGDERHKAIMAAEQAILASGAAIPLAHERVIQGEAAGVTGAQRDPGERALITSATTVKK